jgi:hypothetical protein
MTDEKLHQEPLSQESSALSSQPQEAPTIPPPTQDAPAATPKKKGISKTAWIVGCGCLGLLAVAAVAAAIFLLPLLFGQSAIAEVVPNDTFAFLSVDLLKAQTPEASEAFKVLNEVFDTGKEQTAIEALDETLSDELGMSFSDDVLPWIGTHAALAVVEPSPNMEDAEAMLIFETLNKNAADEFILKFVAALEKKREIKFEKVEKDGLTLYVYDADAKGEDIVVTRSDNLLYISNSEDAVLRSVSLKKEESLAQFKAYQESLAALPEDRIGVLYVAGGEALYDFAKDAFSDTEGFNTASLDQLKNAGTAGLAMSLSVVNVGIRVDIGASYDFEKMSEGQKAVYDAQVLPVTTDALVAEDTFLFIAAHSSMTVKESLDKQGPEYTKDLYESSGVDVSELINFMGGEIALAVGPASDGVLSDMANVDLGLTVMFSVSDEQGIEDWFGAALTKAGMPYKNESAQFGDYGLTEVVVDTGTPTTMLVYGADKGYFILGTSPNLLTKALEDKKTLANDPTYKQTWASFPEGGVPYIYVDLQAFSRFLDDMDASIGSANSFKHAPILAMTLNPKTANGSLGTLILFIKKD